MSKLYLINLRVTIVYDNTTLQPELKADWGFACFIEYLDKKILFDTGTKSKILLDNMKVLGLDPTGIDFIFISHKHGDHMGGLLTVMELNKKAKIYLPVELDSSLDDGRLYKYDKATKIDTGIISSGLLECEERKDLVEQSLFLETSKGLVIIAGCSHSGVTQIIEKSKEFGKPFALIGGFHGFKEFEVLQTLNVVCPTHCTRHIKDIKSLYPEKYIAGGVGTSIEL